MKKVKFRLRRKYVGDIRWTPMAWATNNKKEAAKLAKEFEGDETAHVWDYENKCAL